MKITVNGKEIEIQGNSTIEDVLKQTNNSSKMIVIELNFNIILKEDYVKTKLNEGDNIEIVGFAGGG